MKLIGQNDNGPVFESPILMCGEMVCATMDDTKTQTRRIGKLQSPHYVELGVRHVGHATKGFEAIATYAAFPGRGTARWGICSCPYGKVGDRLWVRETFCPHPKHPRVRVAYRADQKSYGLDNGIAYKTEDSLGAVMPSPLMLHDRPFNREKWKPGIHMPRWASRLTLEITEIRAERLQDISDADALAEGITDAYLVKHKLSSDRRLAYRYLWEAINGRESWKANPWVWVVSFTRL